MERKKQYSVDYFLSLDLGYTREQAESLAASWNFRTPQDPEELLAQARRGVEWERQMRLLNTDRREGRIDEEEYQKRARRLEGDFST